MPKIYQTDDMEAALRAMGAVNRNVIAYLGYYCVRRIRFRRAKCLGIEYEFVKSWTPFAAPAIERWQNTGGTILFMPHPVRRKDPVPPCDALLIAECPLQSDKFDAIVADVKQEVVIYRPPTWELHNETVDSFFPSKDSFICLDLIFKHFVGRDLTEEQERVLALSGTDRRNASVFTAWDIGQLMGWNERKFRYAMNARYRFKYSRFHVYSTRIPPENEDLRWAYDQLCSQPQVATGQYALRFNVLQGGRVNGFETMMKRLMKECYIVREESIYVVDTASRPLDYELIDAVSNMKRGRWFKMKSLVDEAPEYEYGQD